jgi:hypothetical protein
MSVGMIFLDCKELKKLYKKLLFFLLNFLNFLKGLENLGQEFFYMDLLELEKPILQRLVLQRLLELFLAFHLVI